MNATKKRGPGRPAAANPATARVNLRVSPETRKRWHAAAKRAGLSPTDWIKATLDKEADK